MSSIVEICNLALSHIGGYSIQALTDLTKEGRECSRLFAPARDATLEMQDWGFARKEAALAVLTETVEGFDYLYSWPADCVMPRRIYDAAGTSDSDPIPMDQRVNAALDTRCIATDQEDAVLIYTAKVVDANMYSASFVDALGFRLAADLAIPLRADSKLQQNMLQQFRMRIGESGASSANAESKKPPSISSFQNAR